MTKKIENILLVYPKIPENTYWSFSNSLWFINKKTGMPPLGLITIASMLEGYNLRLIDENIEPLKDKDFRWADMMFTSSMVVQSKSLEDIILRATEYDVPIVAGGPYPTQFYDEIHGIDHFVLGEAESGVLKMFIEDLEQGNPKKAYARIALRKNEKGKEIDQMMFQRMKDYFGLMGDIQLVEERPAMNSSPIPRYDLLKVNKYGSMSVQLSRGCPFNCEFCNEPSLFGHESRLKPKEKFVKELTTLYDIGYRGSVFVVDDNFIGNIKEVRDVLPAIQEFQKKHNHPFGFYTEASLNISQDEELMASMRDAGFNMVFVGIESPDEEVLKGAGKYVNARSNLLESVRKIQKYGMEVTAGMIVGMDKEPKNIYDQIFKFSQEAGVPLVMAGLLIPAAGSELYQRLKKENRLLHGENYGNNTHFLDLAYMPDGNRSPGDIIESYKNLLAQLYDPKGKHYFARCRTLIDNLVPGERFVRKIRPQEVMMLIKSVTNQTFQSYGKEYVKFIHYAFTEKREVFPEAVRLAIMGHHFIKLTQETLK